MLSISDLTVKEDEFILLEDINLEIKPNEIHAVIGDFDSGKSSLGEIIAKRPGLEIVSGKITFKRKSLKTLQPEDCSRLGIFLSFQDPPDIVGLTNLSFIEKILTSRNSQKDQLEKTYKEIIKKFDLGRGWSSETLNSSTNVVDRKRNELAQMLMLDPSLVILDTLEEDLDSNTLDEVSEILKEFLSKKGKSAIIISRDMGLLERLEPDHVHLMKKGKIVKSGDKKIIKRISKNGY